MNNYITLITLVADPVNFIGGATPFSIMQLAVAVCCFNDVV